MPAWIPEAWNRLNANNQKQLGDYLQALLSQQEGNVTPMPVPKRKLGALSERFEFMSADFNDPIDDFREYM